MSAKPEFYKELRDKDKEDRKLENIFQASQLRVELGILILFEMRVQNFMVISVELNKKNP